MFYPAKRAVFIYRYMITHARCRSVTLLQLRKVYKHSTQKALYHQGNWSILNKNLTRVRLGLYDVSGIFPDEYE